MRHGKGAVHAVRCRQTCRALLRWSKIVGAGYTVHVTTAIAGITGIIFTPCVLAVERATEIALRCVCWSKMIA